MSENNTLRLKLREVSGEKERSEALLAERSGRLEEQERFINEKLKTVEQMYLHKELELIGKIDKYKEQIGLMRADSEELHRIKSSTATEVSVADSGSPPGDDGGQRLRELEQQNEQLLIQRNQLSKMKESILKDYERKNHELEAVREQHLREIEELKAELHQQEQESPSPAQLETLQD